MTTGSKPTVVCLCGSSRFMKHHVAAMRQETLLGKIVLAMGMYGHKEGLDMDGPTKQMLDELHLRKIDLADEILVINPITPVCPSCRIPCTEVHAIVSGDISDCCGSPVVRRPYIGTSTRREIAYAEDTGKQVRYLNDPE